MGRILAPHEQVATSGVGTPIYFAPELCRGVPYDDRVDVWALGCIVHELATLSPPFEAPRFLALADRIMRSAPAQLPSAYSIELQDLVSQMMEKDDKRRPRTAHLLVLPAVLVRLELEDTRRHQAQLTADLEAAEEETLRLRKQLDASGGDEHAHLSAEAMLTGRTVIGMNTPGAVSTTTPPLPGQTVRPRWNSPKRMATSIVGSPSPSGLTRKTIILGETQSLRIRRGLTMQGSPTRQFRGAGCNDVSPGNTPRRSTCSRSPGKLGPPLRVPRSPHRENSASAATSELHRR
jgi:serine/threonine protein kinase